MDYKESGVNIDTGNLFIKNNLKSIKSTYNKNVLDNVNNFTGLYDISKQAHSILSVTCDGVGSKIKLAIKYNKLYGLGQDLVAMNVNDILCSGARPLLFLDYYATHKLDLENSSNLLSGIIDACKFCGISLIGGETSEMPSVYREGDFDIAGFCVGVADKYDIINPNNVTAGQTIIGVKSSGPHANGYSLINKLVNDNTPKNIIDELLMHTKIYINEVDFLKKFTDLLGVAHVTGGGIKENLIRILPNNISAYIDLSSYIRPEIFDWIKNEGEVDELEMQRVFNLGIGMIVIVNEEDTDIAMKGLMESGVILGYTINSKGKSNVIFR